jgi:hypothetical protein
VKAEEFATQSSEEAIVVRLEACPQRLSSAKHMEAILVDAQPPTRMQVTPPTVRTFVEHPGRPHEAKASCPEDVVVRVEAASSREVIANLLYEAVG